MGKYCRRAGFFTETQRWLENTQEHRWLPPTPGTACTPAAFPNNDIFGDIIGALHTPITSTVICYNPGEVKLIYQHFLYYCGHQVFDIVCGQPVLYVMGQWVPQLIIDYTDWPPTGRWKLKTQVMGCKLDFQAYSTNSNTNKQCTFWLRNEKLIVFFFQMLALPLFILESHIRYKDKSIFPPRFTSFKHFDALHSLTA